MFKFLSSEPLHDPLASPTPLAATEVKTTTCYMCACRCGIRVHLRDVGNGPEVRYIDGNPNHPLNQGVICAKGASGIMKQVSPARLTHPLLRKQGRERGAGEFEPISWELAFQTLTERLGRIRATDPKKFALFTGGIGENAVTLRDRIVRGAAWMGPFDVRVLRTNEEAVIARHTATLA